jgi:dienelactone hydrolase
VAGCANVPTMPSLPAGPTPDAAAGAIVTGQLEVDGIAYGATWYLPQADAGALLLLQHGFSRRCSHLRETTRQLMGAGLMALCIDADLAGGNLPLAEALAARLVDGAPRGLGAPGGRALPQRIVVGGHSAGGRFAARVGAQLAQLAPQRLAGALLFDPVATAGFDADLRRVSDAGRRPVLALLAAAHPCNARLNALPALRQVRQEALAAGRDGFVGVLAGAGATHADVEGEDSDWLAAVACGRPLPAQVAQLRALALRWARAMASGDAPPVPAVSDMGAGWQLIE